MGTQDKRNVVPFPPLAAGGRGQSQQDTRAKEEITTRALSQRRGLDSVEPVLRARSPAAAATPAPAAKVVKPNLNAPALSAVFIASLDDLICQRQVSRNIDTPWPKQADRQLEKVAIDIVDMLFGFIVDHPQIPHRIKESLLSAQLPMLQLATREPEFFADWQHPARLLLNDIGPLLNAYSECGGDENTFTDMFVRGLSRILDGLAPNGAAFAIFHAELREFVTGAAARQQASIATWERAEAAAREFLERPLPQIARDFVAGYWIDVLERTAAQYPEDSPHWQEALAVIEDLAWSLTTKSEEEDRYRLIALIPALLTRLNRGLDLIEVPHADRRPFFDTLIDIHATVLRVETAAAAPVIAQTGTALEQVARLQRGDWVEFRHKDGSVLRERLTWISPQRGLLVFSNHQGQRAIQIGPDDLADLVRENKATLIFDQPDAASGRHSA